LPPARRVRKTAAAEPRPKTPGKRPARRPVKKTRSTADPKLAVKHFALSPHACAVVSSVLKTGKRGYKFNGSDGDIITNILAELEAK
jgi:hypothetical protein